MKRFLFNEMQEAERDKFEERLFGDDEFYYELTDFENLLTDQYAIGKLSTEDTARFKVSLDKLPERREKTANAIALQNYIAEQKAQILEPSLMDKIRNFFIFRKQILLYGTLSVLLVVIIGAGLLLKIKPDVQDNARLQNSQNKRLEETSQNENESQAQNSKSRQEEQNLEKHAEEKDKTNGNVSEQIPVRKEKKNNDLDLEKIKEEKKTTENTKTPDTQKTIIIALLLPISTSKGGGEEIIKIIKIKPETEIIRLSLQIPTENKSESFEAKLNDDIIAVAKKPVLKKSGKRFVSFDLPGKKLQKSEYMLTLSGDNEKVRYTFKLLKN